MNLSILGMIDASLKQEQEARKGKQRSGKYSPSSLGKCFRAQYWNRKDFPKSNPIDERTLRVFRSGDLFHDFVQQVIIKQFPECKVEVMVQDDDFLGFADIVNTAEVIDVKSQHSQSFHYMDKEDIKVSRKPNWLQVMLYAKLLNKERGRLVFVSKDDLSIREYVQPLSDWQEELDAEIKTLKQIWLDDKLPPATPRAYCDKEGKSKECQYCSWLDVCIATEKETT
jgi:hypothetical protein